MKKQYRIEQFPKNKEIRGLSDEQSEIRMQKRYIYGKKMRCIHCLKSLPVAEFYIQDKNTGRRRTGCRDCQMKKAGVKTIGAFRFAKKILKKGFRRCSICKEIKPITRFSRQKNSFAGYNHTCKDCGYSLHKSFQQGQRVSIGKSFVRNYAMRIYGTYLLLNKKEITRLKKEIHERRKPKHFLDGKSFYTKREFAQYILNTYGIPVTSTLSRIIHGYTDADCTLSEFEARSRAKKKQPKKRP